MNNFYSDKQLEKLFGRRATGTPLFEPIELGWLCPKNEKHETTWSEFNDHTWCYDCFLDYFTLLCPKKYIRFHPYMSESIVEKELALVKTEMAKWTLDRYKNYEKEKQ